MSRSFSSRKKRPFNPPAANGHPSQSTQHPRPVCTWSAHTSHSRSWPSPFPRNRHTLTTTATAAGELYLFGGYVHGRATSDLYVFSTQDFSTTLLQTRGEVPNPRVANGSALIGTTLLICGGTTSSGDQNVLNHDSLYILNLGTLDLLLLNPTPVDQCLRSSITGVDSRHSQWSRTGWSSLPYRDDGRFRALRLWWTDRRKCFQ